MKNIDLTSPDASTATRGPGDVARGLLDPARRDHFLRAKGAVFAATHLIIDVAEGAGLDDEARIRDALLACTEACGATLLHLHTHRFSPQGISGVAILAESHISVHTWPEIGYGAFDVFMCGDTDPQAAIPVLARLFQTNAVTTRTLRRGAGLLPG